MARVIARPKSEIPFTTEIYVRVPTVPSGNLEESTNGAIIIVVTTLPQTMAQNAESVILTTIGAILFILFSDIILELDQRARLLRYNECSTQNTNKEQ